MNSNTLTALDRITTLIHHSVDELSELFANATNEECDEINAMLAPGYPFNLSINELSYNVRLWRKEIKTKIAQAWHEQLIETYKQVHS